MAKDILRGKLVSKGPHATKGVGKGGKVIVTNVLFDIDDIIKEVKFWSGRNAYIGFKLNKFEEEIRKDGKYYYFEVILGDREILKKYPKTAHFAYMKGKVFRGLTSSGRKSRGLRKGKGKGHEKNRPSLRAHGKRGTN